MYNIGEYMYSMHNIRHILILPGIIVVIVRGIMPGWHNSRRVYPLVRRGGCNNMLPILLNLYRPICVLMLIMLQFPTSCAGWPVVPV